LGCFLFSGDDVEKKIKILSGGEKARIALAKTIVSKANFLLLDEPTNHLDMHSCDLLIDALNKYEGSFLLVSHDRYFISKTANKIWEIDEHKIREFKGTYEEWVDWKERNLAARQQAANEKAREEKRVQASPVAAPAPAKAVPQPAKSAPPPAAPAAPINKELKKELQKQQRLFQQLEEKIASLSKQKTQLEAALADPLTYSDNNKFRQAEADYKKAGEELEKANKEYEKIFEKIMELEKV
jgi:ATP-binding cassette subfamily F protein 3